jgi:hypothetical protein
MRLSRRLLFLVGIIFTATAPGDFVVLATPGSLRATGRRNHNNDNNERRKTRGGGLSDREEKIAEAMEQEYYRLHPMINLDGEEEVENEYERLLL